MFPLKTEKIPRSGPPAEGIFFGRLKNEIVVRIFLRRGTNDDA